MRYAALAVLAAALAGCAALRGQMAADSEEILSQAGFQRAPLDTPGLPARQLVQTGATYTFADPDFCKCMYVGGAAEYAELRRLRAERIAEHEWAMKSTVYGNAQSPHQWGPWKPEGLDVVTAASGAPAAAGR
jgi:hypothetical protein